MGSSLMGKRVLLMLGLVTLWGAGDRGLAWPTPEVSSFLNPSNPFQGRVRAAIDLQAVGRQIRPRFDQPLGGEVVTGLNLDVIQSVFAAPSGLGSLEDVTRSIVAATANLAFKPASAQLGSEQPLTNRLALALSSKQLSILPGSACGLELDAIAANPAVADEKVMGKVLTVVGDTLTIQTGDGKVRHMTRTRREWGYLGQIAGRKVALSEFFCSRITLAPPPAPVIPAPIPVPPLEFKRRTLNVPPLTPRPVAAPVGTGAEEPTEAIPQTW
ncbi:hypothetical protein BST81_26800 [Leptolyngbya sp. 'hensonii']|uniref:hypothetical protein n=1 Tax=Leptolyngbya sp. 'hensonii' TaxID=1922337 RepID=UPI00094FC575|nr:hypothetical protein [Leptolyngbya sp. 'hensonii']OLP15358.1 hypothetical protein BST81_26800 [Leptolyngbya sp. 'hensonii']